MHLKLKARGGGNYALKVHRESIKGWSKWHTTGQETRHKQNWSPLREYEEKYHFFLLTNSWNSVFLSQEEQMEQGRIGQTNLHERRRENLVETLTRNGNTKKISCFLPSPNIANDKYDSITFPPSREPQDCKHPSTARHTQYPITQSLEVPKQFHRLQKNQKKFHHSCLFLLIISTYFLSDLDTNATDTQVPFPVSWVQNTTEIQIIQSENLCTDPKLKQKCLMPRMPRTQRQPLKY